MLNVGQDVIVGMPIALPPLAEQRALLTFVNDETAKIDALIAEQQRLTELLTEKRQAVIAHAVTKGLNPAAPMKARMFPVVTARAPMAINQALKAVMARAHVSGEFLAWLLRASAEASLSRLDEAGHGTKALRMDAWGEMRVPVPPLAEQFQIAENLNSAYSETSLGLLDV